MDAAHGNLCGILLPGLIEGKDAQQAIIEAFLARHLGLESGSEVKVELHQHGVLLAAQVRFAVTIEEITVGATHLMAQSCDIILAQVILEQR